MDTIARYYKGFNVVAVIGIALLILKVSIIGYYPSELPMIILGFLVTLGIAGLGELGRRRQDALNNRQP